jgi:hypothetical protein
LTTQPLTPSKTPLTPSRLTQNVKRELRFEQRQVLIGLN